MILAAGRGKRLGVLTLDKPKPMIRIGNKPLIAHALESLQQARIHYCVINLSHLGAQIREFVGGGDRWRLRVLYSEERGVLETGGGIRKALPLLGGRDPFLVVNADLLHDINIRSLVARNGRNKTRAHLVLKKSEDGKGDFSLRRGKVIAGKSFVFCGVSILRPALFHYGRLRRFRLADLLKVAVQDGVVSGEVHAGVCLDLGTPSDLAAAARILRTN